MESLNAFIGCRQAGRPHELLLICSGCGQVEERRATGVMAALTREARQATFQPRHLTVEIHGLCARCADEEDRPAGHPSATKPV